ncbi:hypothetical protein IMCC3317_33450 [Kordia antarctica]|uniref:Bacteriophage abortive infection AbiH n=1 Tax=Kordia antarctica TaxID=1218801 RepID=A0A7L4ZMR5_9FLAO|nr:AbiH family protein [Kordia antarctica]QHI37962.1 hypothetical protein IMCC3317_33450 [Kordia antarctica]
MNKLIIAGNGFDLAHGLPTSYNNFMDAFWRDLKDDFEDELVKELVYIHPLNQDHFSKREVTNFKDFENNIHNYLKRNFRVYELDKYCFSQKGRAQNYDNQTILFKFKNQFFKELNKTQSIQNWVDVENEYYQALKNICKDEKLLARHKKEDVLKLHREFEQVKQLLEKYLQKNVVEAYNWSIEDSNSLLRILKPYESLDRILMLAEEFSIEEDITEIEKLMEVDSRSHTQSSSTETQILNFNYTPTFNEYVKSRKLTKFNIDINHIHGELNENIVFGFGDEMDEDYKLIEDMDDNEYLKYFKSFQYVQNSYYKDVLRFVDYEKFQVVIMGHSCGLSDRTLLNTIFEHENCRSIKVFYHQKEDGSDNYTEIIQNISRHFNDKKLMRTKIVEKTLCEPMPQIQLPKLVK